MRPHQRIVDIARAFPKKTKPKQETHTQDKCMFSSWSNTDGKPQMPLSGCRTQQHVNLSVDIPKCPPLPPPPNLPSSVCSDQTGAHSATQPGLASPTNKRSHRQKAPAQPMAGRASPGCRERGCPLHTRRGRPEGRELQRWEPRAPRPAKPAPAPRRASNTLS